MRIRETFSGKTWEIEASNLDAGPNFRYIIGHADPTSNHAFTYYAFTFAELARAKFSSIKLKDTSRITFIYDSLVKEFTHICPVRNIFVLEN